MHKNTNRNKGINIHIVITIAMYIDTSVTHEPWTETCTETEGEKSHRNT